MKIRFQSSRLKTGFSLLLLAGFVAASAVYVLSASIPEPGPVAAPLSRGGDVDPESSMRTGAPSPAAAERRNNTVPGATPAPATLEESSWRVLVEPRFMRSHVSQPVPNAKATVMAAGWTDSTGEVHCFAKLDFDQLRPPGWAAFAEKTQAAATAELARLTPEYSRDRNRVVECAILRSDRQTTASAIFAPGFLKRFSDVFGAKLLVAIPNRFTIYVFPALASRYQDYATRVASDYHNSSYPVSLELFELSAQGLRAIGTLEAPNGG